MQQKQPQQHQRKQDATILPVAPPLQAREHLHLPKDIGRLVLLVMSGRGRDIKEIGPEAGQDQGRDLDDTGKQVDLGRAPEQIEATMITAAGVVLDQDRGREIGIVKDTKCQPTSSLLSLRIHHCHFFLLHELKKILFQYIFSFLVFLLFLVGFDVFPAECC